MNPSYPRLIAPLVGALLLWAAPATAQVKKQEIIKEVQEAFKTWEQISCSKLKFEYAGEQPTYISEKEGGILVLFGHDAATWSHETLAYWTSSDWKLDDKGDLYKATIELNAKDWWWSIGKEKNKIDIRTAVLHMIPGTIGFYVGADPITLSLRAFIDLDRVEHTLHPLHETGAQFDYFESGASCTQPGMPPICGMAPPTPDMGVADAAAAADATADDAGPDDAAATDVADAGAPIQLCIMHSSPNDLSKGQPLHWYEQPIKYWIYLPDNAGKLPGSTNIGGDGSGTDGPSAEFDGGPPKACTTDNDCPDGFVCKDNVCVTVGSGDGGDDDGCCRVGHSHPGHLPGALLLMLGLALLALRARQR